MFLKSLPIADRRPLSEGIMALNDVSFSFTSSPAPFLSWRCPYFNVFVLIDIRSAKNILHWQDLVCDSGSETESATFYQLSSSGDSSQ